MRRVLAVATLVAACSGQATPQAPSRAEQTKLEPKPEPVRVAKADEPAARIPPDGRPFAKSTVESLGPVALSGDGRRLVALSESGNVTMVWNAEDGALLADYDGPMRGPGATAEGLVTLDDHFVAWFWDKETLSRAEVVVFKPGADVKWRLPAVWGHVSPDATMFAVYTAGKSDSPQGIRLYRWPELVLERTLPSYVAAGLAFTPDNNRLFEGEEFGRLAMWDTMSGHRTPLLSAAEPLNASVHVLDVSPDGRMLLVGASPYVGRDETVLLQLWSTDQPRLLDNWPGEEGVFFAAFLDDATIVYNHMGPFSDATVLRRDRTTREWRTHKRFANWGPDHAAVDRTRRILYGVFPGIPYVRCLDLTERGQCPDRGENLQSYELSPRWPSDGSDLPPR